jgi:hypothetical protein
VELLSAGHQYSRVTGVTAAADGDRSTRRRRSQLRTHGRTTGASSRLLDAQSALIMIIMTANKEQRRRRYPGKVVIDHHDKTDIHGHRPPGLLKQVNKASTDESQLRKHPKPYSMSCMQKSNWLLYTVASKPDSNQFGIPFSLLLCTWWHMGMHCTAA